ncbi:MAG: sugar phosphate isomerase/epimerase family protein [Opitutus sp.]
MHRRQFLKFSAVAAACASTGLRGEPTLSAAPVAKPASKGPRSNPKGFMLATLNSKTSNALSVGEKFQLLRDAGFAGVEVMSAMDQSEVLAARDATGLKIPSVVIASHWARPLSDGNPGIRAAGLEGLMQGLRDAKAYGATSVLLVPGAVTKEVSYAQAYERSFAEISKAVPLAESLGVVIAIENVWNRFLLSPLEAVAYVDAFKSPQVRWHLDVGNIVNTGWPEHWIRTLGARIVKVHVKEYSRALRDTKGPFAGFEIELMRGDSDWPTVMTALDEIHYDGWMIAEQHRPEGLTDAEWLGALSRKMDEVIHA